MRFTLALIAALLITPATALEAGGLGVIKLGATVDETIAAMGPGALRESEAVNDVQRVFRATAPVRIGGLTFDMRLEFEPDRLGVIGLWAEDPAATHALCLRRFRAVVADLESDVGPLTGGRADFEGAWPAPRIEQSGASELRFYTFVQSRGAVLHRAVATARARDIIEVTAWAWDGGVHNTPIPNTFPTARCRIAIELKTDLGG